MALQVCLDCTTKYSTGAVGCPHCGSTTWAEEGTDEATDAAESESEPGAIEEPDEE